MILTPFPTLTPFLSTTPTPVPPRRFYTDGRGNVGHWNNYHFALTPRRNAPNNNKLRINRRRRAKRLLDSWEANFPTIHQAMELIHSLAKSKGAIIVPVGGTANEPK